MDAPVILENVGYSYKDGTSALVGVSASFPERAVTAVLGQNGSGKSTLLNLINGILTPSRGTVRVFGEIVSAASALRLRRKTGYVVQGPALFPHMTVAENILLMTRITGDRQELSTAIQLLERMSLPAEYADRYPYQLSGGEQQRVSICRALCHQPHLLLMDEALNALDVFTRKEIQDSLLQYHRSQPLTVILITHDPSEAIRMADYIMLLDEGKIQRFDSKKNIMTDPGPILGKFLSIA